MQLGGAVQKIRELISDPVSVGQAALAVLPRVLAPRPHSLEQVNPEWLSKSIGGRVAGARVERTEVVGGHSGTTSRQRLRLQWNEAGRSAGLPGVVFIKTTPDCARNRTMVAALRMSSTEVDFYRTVRADLPKNMAPIAFVTVKGPGARFLLVLEDMDERGHRPYSILDRCTPEHALAVTTALATLHAPFWESPRFASDLSWVRPASERAGRWYQREFDRRARTRITSTDYAKDFPADVRRVIRLFGDNAPEMDRIAERPPLTLVHGDSHLGKTWTTQEGHAGLYDWQLIHRRHGIQDFAHFLVSAIPTSLRRKHERPLVEHYVMGLQANGVRDASIDEIWDRYRLAVAYKWDSVATTVAFAGMQPIADPVAAFKRVNNAIVDLGTADAVEQALASR